MSPPRSLTVQDARAAGLLSDEHFTVDGTQLEAWGLWLDHPASRRPIPSDVDEAKWRISDVLLDNRQGLVANVCATHATGTAERDAAVLLLEASASPGSTVGADKGYDVARFVADVRAGRQPHVAQKVRCDRRSDHADAGYHVSQRKRKLVEQVFWMKTGGGLPLRSRHRPGGFTLVRLHLER